MQDFVTRFRAKYDDEPDSFSAGAYDTMVLWAKLVEGWGPTGRAWTKGLAEIKDVPSVIYGKVTFDPDPPRARRRLQAAGGAGRQVHGVGRQGHARLSPAA